jgi:uncharacterized membrane protein
MNNKINGEHLLKHETKQQVLIKFILVALVFWLYFVFISQKYGVQQGFFIAALVWSFFVLCTPIADAGFLLDFPLRLITKIRMFVSEIAVWIIAISLNIYTYFSKPEIYAKTKILTLFKYILDHPFPFWSIIFVSMVGTFVSIRFGDELLDKINHKERKMHKKHQKNHKFIIMISLFILTFIFYDFLLKGLGINFLA